MNPLRYLLNYKNPTKSEMPSIHLYMDQLLEYFQNTMKSLMRQTENTIFTKTMINNYVKSKVIKAPNKKKYDQETLCDLTIIYHLKKAFSLQDTSFILERMKESEDYYTEFVHKQLEVRALLTTAELDETDFTREEALEQLKQLTQEVVIKKQLAEQLIDYLNSNNSVA